MEDFNQRAFINYDSRFEPPDEDTRPYAEGMINNELELIDEIGIRSEGDTLKTARAKLERAIYKFTDCGAWIAFEMDSIVVGSIVEGVEETTSAYRLIYPFSFDEYNKALDAVEEEAMDIWNRTHGCPWCYNDGDEDEWLVGDTPVNPDCKHCAGNGTVI